MTEYVATVTMSLEEYRDSQNLLAEYREELEFATGKIQRLEQDIYELENQLSPEEA